MSDVEDESPTEQSSGASSWTQFCHHEDLFSQAHRMLIGEDEVDEKHRSRRNAERDTVSVLVTSGAGKEVIKEGSPSGGDDDSKTKKMETRVRKMKRKAPASAASRPAVVLKTLPPLLRMPMPLRATPPVHSGAAKSSPPRHSSSPKRCNTTPPARRVSPPPLLPLSSTHFTSTPTYSTSPSASPPSKRTTPSTSPLSQRIPMAPITKPLLPPTTSTDCYSPTREEMEEELRLKRKVCGVCGDEARSMHFGGLACDSCKAFFRRAVVSNIFSSFVCYIDHHCAITVDSRRNCQACRFAGCLRAGMEVSLARREEEASGKQQTDPFYHHHRLDRSHNRLHSHNTIYNRNPSLDPSLLGKDFTLGTNTTFSHIKGLHPASVHSFGDAETSGMFVRSGNKSRPLLSYSPTTSHGFPASFIPLDVHGCLSSQAYLASHQLVDRSGPASSNTSVSSPTPSRSQASTSRRSPTQSCILTASHSSAKSHTHMTSNNLIRSHISGSSDRHANSQTSMSASPPKQPPMTPRHTTYSPTINLGHTTLSPVTTQNHSRSSPTVPQNHTSHSSVTTQAPNNHSAVTTLSHNCHSPMIPLSQNRHLPIITLSPSSHSLMASHSQGFVSSHKSEQSYNSHTSAPSHKSEPRYISNSDSIDTRAFAKSWTEDDQDPPVKKEPVEDHQNIDSGNSSPTACFESLPQQPLNLSEEAVSVLKSEDHVEIKELHRYYNSSFDLPIPVSDRMIRTEELGKMYSYFIQRRARFLVSTPLYKTLALKDRQKLLHTAVAMSTYYTGAHLMDTTDFTWKSSDGTAATTIMSVSTIRPVLSHEQFMYMMRFYVTYSPFFSDQTVTILMQVLSLFYSEPGLTEARVVEEGRVHYIDLLSRYLISIQGPRVGQEHLRILLDSQQEARSLVNLLQHVDLTPRVPRHDVVNAKKILMEGIQLVFDKARKSMTRVPREKHIGYHTDESSPVTTQCESRDTIISAGTSSLQDEDRVNFIQSTFIRLANCEDPQILANARRILPSELILKFLKVLQETPFPDKAHI